MDSANTPLCNLQSPSVPMSALTVLQERGSLLQVAHSNAHAVSLKCYYHTSYGNNRCFAFFSLIWVPFCHPVISFHEIGTLQLSTSLQNATENEEQIQHTSGGK